MIKIGEVKNDKEWKNIYLLSVKESGESVFKDDDKYDIIIAINDLYFDSKSYSSWWKSSGHLPNTNQRYSGWAGEKVQSLIDKISREHTIRLTIDTDKLKVIEALVKL